MSEVQSLLIKFDNIDGTSNLKGYEKYIPINNLSFDMHASVTFDNSGVLANKGAKISTIRFTKVDDIISDDVLNKKMLTTEVFKEVIIVKVITHDGKLIENRKVTLKNVCIVMAETNMSNDGVAVNAYVLATTSYQRKSNIILSSGKIEPVGPDGYNFGRSEKI